MGYLTQFIGGIRVQPPLNMQNVQELNAFCTSKRVKRNIARIAFVENLSIQEATTKYGKEGDLYAGDDKSNIVNDNEPPCSQPSTWCHWIYNSKTQCIEWNGISQFNNYVKWLYYIRDTFIHRFGSILGSGKIIWQGEDESDCGSIDVMNNNITVTYSSEKNNVCESPVVIYDVEDGTLV
jgi:hypothetical protein